MSLLRLPAFRTRLAVMRPLPALSRTYASDKGKQELYSDESGSIGAGIDDVAHTDAAYDTSKGPEESAKGIEKEVSFDLEPSYIPERNADMNHFLVFKTGKGFSSKSPANAQYSEDKPNEAGKENGMPLSTSKVEAEQNGGAKS
jgi:hypothetical protein